MKEFIVNLYANKYFPIYLGIIIIVLLIAFFIVFFLGKKDQKKIEETQRLNKEDLQKGNKLNTIENNQTEVIKNDNSNTLEQNTVVETNNNSKAGVITQSPVMNAASEVKLNPDNVMHSVNNTVLPTNPIQNSEKEMKNNQTPIVNEVKPVTNNIAQNETQPKVSTPVQNNINKASVTSINEVKPTIQNPNEIIMPTSQVQNKQVNISQNANNNTMSNNLTSNISEIKPVKPKDIVMPVVEKTPINSNNEIKKEVVEINSINPQKIIQKNNIDDDSYKAASSKAGNSSQDAINRFQNIASSIDKELTELEKQQKTFSQINTNIENNNLNNNKINIPNSILEEPKVKEEKKESNTTVVSNIYSSVYVPNKNVVENKVAEKNIDYDETMSIELPKLKEEPILKDEEKDDFKFI
ncbi:MAG: hypothetical protein ACI4XR_03560 [Bacilli bacterium]